MHGIALSILMNRDTRTFSSAIAEKKRLDYLGTTNGKHSLWQQIENLSNKEKLTIGLYSMYMKILARREE